MSFEFFRKTEGDRENRGELGLGLLIGLTKGHLLHSLHKHNGKEVVWLEKKTKHKVCQCCHFLLKKTPKSNN